MTPLLMQMALFSAIDSTERSVGAQAYSVRGEIDFDGGSVRVDDVYSGDVGVAVVASADAPDRRSLMRLQSGFDALKLKTVTLDVAPVERRRQQQVVDLMAARTVASRRGSPALPMVMEGERRSGHVTPCVLSRSRGHAHRYS